MARYGRGVGEFGSAIKVKGSGEAVEDGVTDVEWERVAATNEC